MEDQLALGEILQSFCDKLTVGQKILVAVAWAREDEVQLFKKCPHVFMFDVTFNKNSKKRPLGVSLGIDGNMNSFSSFRIFMPSRCAWVHNWIFGHVMPALLSCNLFPLQGLASLLRERVLIDIQQLRMQMLTSPQ